MYCLNIPFIKCQTGEMLNLAYITKVRVNRYWNGNFYVEGLTNGIWYNLKSGFDNEEAAETWMKNILL